MKENMAVSLWDELNKLLGGGGKGLIFETLGHMKLTQSNKECMAKPLRKRGRKVVKLKFNLNKVLTRSVDDIAALEDGCYGLPIFGNFMLVDAIIKPNTLLHFTVSRTHGNKADGARNWEAVSEIITKYTYIHISAIYLNNFFWLNIQLK